MRMNILQINISYVFELEKIHRTTWKMSLVNSCHIMQNVYAYKIQNIFTYIPEPKRRFIAQSLSCSPFHCLEMTEILLKGRKTLTHPSIFTYKTGNDTLR